mmetsp:Transcript_10919/g.20030  ORF Transcript_10919/g.20030 Transcript_10919/m.20030 type:complete len:268 (+) Transcript_10919:52-855(+)
MGCGAVYVSGPESFDVVLAKEVQAYNNEFLENNANFKKKKYSLQTMCLAFPRVRKGFEKLRQGYLALEDERMHGITFETLCEAEIFKSVGSQKLMQYLLEADVDFNKIIDFREYILAITFIFYLHQNMRKNYDERLIQIFELIGRAWCAFDHNKSGFISKKKTIALISRERKSDKVNTESVFVERFNELDCNRDGEVSFKEFFCAFLEWSGVEYEDDIFDDDGGAAAAPGGGAAADETKTKFRESTRTIGEVKEEEQAAPNDDGIEA